MKQTIVAMMMALAFMVAAPVTLASNSVADQGSEVSTGVETAPTASSQSYGDGDKDEEDGEKDGEDDEEDGEGDSW